MKQLIVTLLVLLTLGSTLRELSIFVSFKVHQEEIAFTVCKSKNEVDNTCQGACYLQDQLSLTNNHEHAHEETTDVIPSFKLKINYYFETLVGASSMPSPHLEIGFATASVSPTSDGFIRQELNPPEYS